jgi:murein L,D-transpeptidase YafK
LTNPVVRALLGAAAVVAAIALAGCNADDVSPTGRAMAPLSPKMLALIKAKDMDKYSPILVRVFKQESDLEVWKKNRDGQYALLKTYPICRWSGDLGPKKKEGDRQAPEGFYTITPGQMNPNSNYYLAFNTGYPNAYDRSHGYTGSELMVHGDCSSRGCYAMTDEQIQQIYALARDSFFGGQREFQFEAFPFRMTALNMAKHRNNPNFKFWKMLKQGYDDFEATHQEPKIAVCDRHYVFDAAPRPGEKGPLRFNPSGRCPAYQLDPTLAPTITAYRRQQEIKMANYIARGVPLAAPHVGDGGMNPVFAKELGLTTTADDNNGRYSVASLDLKPGAMTHPPGELPHVPNPPGTTIPKVGDALAQEQAVQAAAQTAPASPPQPAQTEPQSEPVMTASVPMPEPAPLPKEGKPLPEKKPTSIASLFGHLFSAKKQPAPAAAPTQVANADSNAPVALRGTTTAAKSKKGLRTASVRTAAAPISLHPSPQHAGHKPVAVAKAAPAKREPKAVAKAEPAHKAQSVWAAADRQLQRQKKPKPEPEIRTAFSAPPSANGGLLAGAQPVMPAGSFSSRWSALR